MSSCPHRLLEPPTNIARRHLVALLCPWRNTTRGRHGNEDFQDCNCPRSSSTARTDGLRAEVAPQPPRRLRPRQLRPEAPRRIPRRAADFMENGPPATRNQAFAVSQYESLDCSSSTDVAEQLASHRQRVVQTGSVGPGWTSIRRGPGRCHGDHRGCREADRLHDQCDRQSLTRQDRGLPGPVRAAGATAQCHPPVTSDSRSRWSESGRTFR